MTDFLNVTTDVSSYDCDCCGSYEYGTLSVKFADKEFIHTYDGHFGGGEWDGTESSKTLLVISDLLDVSVINLDMPDYTHTIFNNDYNSDQSMQIFCEDNDHGSICTVTANDFFLVFNYSEYTEAIEDEAYLDQEKLFEHILEVVVRKTKVEMGVE